MSARIQLVYQFAVISGKGGGGRVKDIDKIATDSNLNFKYSRAACGFSGLVMRAWYRSAG